MIQIDLWPSLLYCFNIEYCLQLPERTRTRRKKRNNKVGDRQETTQKITRLLTNKNLSLGYFRVKRKISSY